MRVRRTGSALARQAAGCWVPWAECPMPSTRRIIQRNIPPVQDRGIERVIIIAIILFRTPGTAFARRPRAAKPARATSSGRMTAMPIFTSSALRSWAIAVSAGGPGSERGCMLCNVAAERAPFDPASERVVAGYVDRIQRAIGNALDNARRRGEVDPDVAIEDQARWFTSSLLGFWLLMRAGVDAEVLRGAARAWHLQLAALRVGGSRCGAGLLEGA